jgi:hypothetical protein
MPSSIFSSLFSTFDSRTIGEIASRFGESKAAVSQGLESSTACLLGGLANKAGDSNWMSQLFKLVSQAPSNVNASDLTSAIADPSRVSSATSSLLDSGKKFLNLALGGNQSSIFDTVARSTGLRSDVVSSLMSMAAPLMMTTLGRLVRDDHMNPTGLSRLLVHEGQGVRDLLPAGTSDLLNATPPSTPTVTASTRPVALGTIAEPAARSRGLWWLIPALLLPLLLYLGVSRPASSSPLCTSESLYHLEASGQCIPKHSPERSRSAITCFRSRLIQGCRAGNVVRLRSALVQHGFRHAAARIPRTIREYRRDPQSLPECAHQDWRLHRQ